MKFVAKALIGAAYGVAVFAALWWFVNWIAGFFV